MALILRIASFTERIPWIHFKILTFPHTYKTGLDLGNRVSPFIRCDKMIPALFPKGIIPAKDNGHIEGWREWIHFFKGKVLRLINA